MTVVNTTNTIRNSNSNIIIINNNNTETAKETTTPRAAACTRLNLIAQTCDIPNVEGNYTQGCQFSPDGLCVLTATANDHKLRLYNTPYCSDIDSSSADNVQNAVLTYKEGDCIRDYTWYPKMNSNDPSTCVFLSASK